MAEALIGKLQVHQWRTVKDKLGCFKPKIAKNDAMKLRKVAKRSRNLLGKEEREDLGRNPRKTQGISREKISAALGRCSELDEEEASGVGYL